MKFLSVCSGVEAASVAWEPLGWEAVGFSDIMEYPSRVLKNRFPNIKNYGDMNDYQEWEVEPFDLLCGGTPCQSFSIAGLRAGLTDPRGNLALVFAGILDKWKPRWFLWENVTGVLSSSMRLMNSGIRSRGVCLTLKTSVAPLDVQESLLSDILETTGDLPPEYFLRPSEATTILKQTERLKKELPAVLNEAYKMVANPSP